MAFPVIKVTCSCKRQTTLYFSGKQYFSLDPGWSTSYDDAGYYQGWSCGRDGHKQIPLNEDKK